MRILKGNAGMSSSIMLKETDQFTKMQTFVPTHPTFYLVSLVSRINLPEDSHAVPQGRRLLGLAMEDTGCLTFPFGTGDPRYISKKTVHSYWRIYQILEEEVSWVKRR